MEEIIKVHLRAKEEPRTDEKAFLDGFVFFFSGWFLVSDYSLKKLACTTRSF